MGAVGGSRHYSGGGLGQEGMWGCPSCGEENQGPIAQGCAACGAGRPGRHIGTAPPAPAPRIVVEEPAGPEPAAAPAPEPAEELTTFARWRARHPEASVEDAFTAGYVEGFRDGHHRGAHPSRTVSVPPQQIIPRTLIAALELFRDQVLLSRPEEVTTGEWLSAEQVTELIAEIIKGEGIVHG